MGSRPRHHILSLLALGAGLACSNQAIAQAGGEGFLFSEPAAVVGVHVGFSRADANSDVFSFLTDLLTLERGDFTGISFGGSIHFPVSERVSLGVNGFYSTRTSGSEYRDWVDQDDLPIEQRTNFVRIPLLATARVHLLSRGEKIGSLAWIPATYAPYVGVGGGVMWHRLRIVGDMFDYGDPQREIYNSVWMDSGWSPALQALAGVDVNLSPLLMVTGEASYIRSKAQPGPTVTAPDEPLDLLDLSGITATVGISVRL